MDNVIQKTFDRLTEILKDCNVFRSITPENDSTGNCTLVLSGDLQKSINEFVDYLTRLPEEDIKAKTIQKSKGIVSFDVPLASFEEVPLKVVAKVKSSDESNTFIEQFEHLGQEKKTLVKALVSTILQVESPETVFKRLGIGKVPELKGDQEYKFDLEDDNLTLNIQDWEAEESYGVWESSNWNSVEKLLKGFDLTKDFDNLLSDIASLGSNVKNEIRSLLATELKDREARVSKVHSVLGEAEESENNQKVAIFVGKFRPPHKKHFSFVENILKKVDRLIILLNKENEPTVPLNAEQAVSVWKIYRKYLNKVVEVRTSDNIKADIEQLTGNSELADVSFTIYSTGTLTDLVEYNNVQLKRCSAAIETYSAKLVKGSLTQVVEKLNKITWLPECLTRDDKKKVINTVVSPLVSQTLEECKQQAVDEILKKVGLSEASSGTPISPSVGISSGDRGKLADLYSQLQDQCGEDFNIQFHNTSIVIKTKYPTEMSPVDYDSEKLYEEQETQQEFDYVPYMASYLKFLQKEGKQIEPLPEIILNKDSQKSDDILLQKTGEYDPDKKLLTIYTKGRGAKDCLRSFAHEMQHHIQCLEGRIQNIKTTNIQEDKNLEELEAEAYREGNLMFRKWTTTNRK